MNRLFALILGVLLAAGITIITIYTGYIPASVNIVLAEQYEAISETATVNKQANSVQPTGTAASSLSLPGRPAQRVQKSTYVRDLRRRDAKIQELRETATVYKQANSVQTAGSPASSSSLPGRPAQRVQESTETANVDKQPGTASSSTLPGRPAQPVQESRLESSSYPDWWLQAWPQSAVTEHTNTFVGDTPLFPPCTASSRSGSAYGFVEPRAYLSNSKNPCWYEQPKSKKGLNCLPYVYMAGVAKCGTTDLSRRLRMHPDMFEGTLKEYHWWERYRFASVPLKTYLSKITGRELLDLKKELDEKGSSVKIFGDFSPSYLWDPRNWQELDGNQGCLEPRVIHTQHIRHVFPAAKIILTFRHPTPRLYSRFMSRIPRTSWLRKASTGDFHRYVVQGVKKYKACFKTWSIRHCAYNESVYKDAVVRLVEGMYPVFMQDWLRVWPREQLFVMRYEDYGGHERERISEVLDFLGLAALNRTEMDRLMEMDVLNSGQESYDKYGPMLPETKAVLDDFYRPFVTKFADLLHDQRFLWRDVTH